MLVPLINSLGYILVGILGIYIALTKFNIKITIPSIRDIKYHLREGWYVFISTIAINMYTTTNTFLLGLLTNNTLVGYYSIAEKIILAVNGLLNPISQALYPFISRTVKTDDKTYVNSVIILQIISIVPLAVSLSTVFGVETMLTFNYKKAFTSIVMIGGIIDIVLGIILITLMKEIGIAISFATTEIFITIAMFIFLQRKGIKIINRNHTKLS